MAGLAAGEHAGVAELVDAPDLKSVGTLSREGSSPSLGTILVSFFKW